jgi:hypothetical protein
MMDTKAMLNCAKQSVDTGLFPIFHPSGEFRAEVHHYFSHTNIVFTIYPFVN